MHTSPRSSSTTCKRILCSNNVETYLMSDPSQREHVLGKLQDYVVKAVGE